MNKNFHIWARVLLGSAAIAAGFGAVVMLLWNALLPQIFGIASINFWQALGLLALCRMLFGGFGGDGRMFAGKGGHHKNRIREKWQNMSDEERREFIKDRHFGHGHGFGRDFFDREEPEKKD
ncbi:MAG: hypothetical protein LBF89_06475 [Bacteroidales bacterium]|jgi:hypothetical protein|nr:hypothetical protein [Bacteroidales bacterium]